MKTVWCVEQGILTTEVTDICIDEATARTKAEQRIGELVEQGFKVISTTSTYAVLEKTKITKQVKIKQWDVQT